ncbi:DNA polymerase IV [Haladaptatus sp. GCM10025707]|uniref:DNA polymerase IV n=1 Tax=unclassified Haladaptatus TaxID=2622732 RepID=UPI0023E7A7E1|nr:MULTISPECIES: DNA polymerase IV [unclassified Haladaptatus]
MGNSGGARLPGVSHETGPERIILHVDMDCFYAACERLREPTLRGQPVVVGMGYEPGEAIGAVATASYEARAFGVESAQPISKALELLPRIDDADDGEAGGYYRPVDISFYKEVSAEVKTILRDCADTLREVSIDEAYLDVTDRTAWEKTPDGTRTLAEGYARYVKQRIARKVGVTASIGVAPNMSAAKVASDFEKPDGLTVVEPGTVREFLAPLDIEFVHGIGPVTARKLREMDIETAGDLASADRQQLVDRFGERGREMHDRANGDDAREVEPVGKPKSFSRESAFPQTADADQHRKTVRRLAKAVAERADREGALYQTIGIKVVTPPFDVNTRATSLSGPVQDASLVESVALSLLTEFEGETARKLGVRVSKLSFAAEDQASLDSWGSDGGEQSTPENHARRGQRSLSEFD